MEAKRIERYLKNSIAKGRLSSAYLFFAGSSEDKEKAALNFAKAIECEKKDFPCNSCENCLKIESFVHPDVKWLRGEGVVSSLTIDELREIQKEMYFKPYQGKKRVYIFEVERLNEETSNAFLKTLEEPPEYTTLLLIAKSDKEFLPTIVSRCQKIMFSSGKRVLKKEEKEIQERLIAAMNSLSLQNPLGIFAMAEEIINENEIDSSLKLLLSFYRDLLLLKNGADKRFLTNPELTDEELSSSQIMEIIELIINTRAQIHQSANLKLSLEVMLMNILAIKGGYGGTGRRASFRS
ncbi:MAG: DNA polymerase III subunit [Candidatus Omnitrophica bacterium]|nr:DNA polymerase III subunit [Candidatus Omnitrophota bacterium]